MGLLDWICLVAIIAICVMSGRPWKTEIRAITPDKTFEAFTKDVVNQIASSFGIPADSVGEPMPRAVLITRMAAIAAAPSIVRRSARMATPIGKQLLNQVSLPDGSGMVEFSCEPQQVRLEIVNWIHEQAWGPRYKRDVDRLLDQKLPPTLIDSVVVAWCQEAKQAIPRN